MRRNMLCSSAARWCGVTEEYQSKFEVAGRGLSLSPESVQQQWSCSGRPVYSDMATQLLLLVTNFEACRQCACVDVCSRICKQMR